MVCKVAFCFTSLDVQFEDVPLHAVVELATVEFCSEEVTLLDVEFSAIAGVTVEFKGRAFACEIQIGNTKTPIKTNIGNA